MNYRGSSKRLFGNSISAMLGAIEIYNKPQFPYRDEVFVVLLMNAWELLLKAIVSKSGGRIYYPKRRGEPYKTLSRADALKRAVRSDIWPSRIEANAVDANLELLGTFRDNVVHFYNQESFGSLVYSLAQTSIINYRDLASSVFAKDTADDISWRIMPLGVRNPVDPIQFMKRSDATGASRAVQEFLALLKDRAEELEAAGADTGRLLTVFDVSLQSIKKISKADVVAGIATDDTTDTTIIRRPMDPNLSHPFRQKEVLPRLKSKLNAYDFQAIVTRYELKGNRQYWWEDDSGAVVRWSPDVIRYIDSLTDEEIKLARQWYSAWMARRRAGSD